MWYVNWHIMEPRFRGLYLITYLDDSSRCVTGARLFKEITSDNAVIVLRDVIKKFGTPATILSDNSSCFVRIDTETPTAFESELLDLGIELINSKPHKPQA